MAIAGQYIQMGFLPGRGAYLGYPSSAALRETVKDVPNSYLLLETDCPFLRLRSSGEAAMSPLLPCILWK